MPVVLMERSGDNPGSMQRLERLGCAISTFQPQKYNLSAAAGRLSKKFDLAWGDPPGTRVEQVSGDDIIHPVLYMRS